MSQHIIYYYKQKPKQMPDNNIQIITSKQFAIDWRDVGKSLIIAVGTALVATLAAPLQKWMLDSTSFSIDKADLILAVKASIYAMFVTLTTRFFNPTKTIIKGLPSDSNPDK